MKRKKMKPEKSLKHSVSGGFTLIEAMISLFLVLIGVIFITQVIIFSIDINKKSFLRLKLWQTYENQIHSLLSKPFNSETLQPGCYSCQQGLFKIKWKVMVVNQTLKKIDICIIYKQVTKQGYFFKSKTLKTNSDF